MNNNTLTVVQQYLNSHNVLCLATSHHDKPWVSPVFYASTDSGLIFLSAPHTRHCKNIAANANVSASIQHDCDEWKDIKGIQLEGIVAIIPEAQVSRVIECYSEKFPVTGDQAPPEIAKALDKIHWFQLIVSQLFFIDNSQGLGHREEIDPSLLFISSGV